MPAAPGQIAPGQFAPGSPLPASLRQANSLRYRLAPVSPCRASRPRSRGRTRKRHRPCRRALRPRIVAARRRKVRRAMNSTRLGAWIVLGSLSLSACTTAPSSRATPPSPPPPCVEVQVEPVPRSPAPPPSAPACCRHLRCRPRSPWGRCGRPSLRPWWRRRSPLAPRPRLRRRASIVFNFDNADVSGDPGRRGDQASTMCWRRRARGQGHVQDHRTYRATTSSTSSPFSTSTDSPR